MAFNEIQSRYAQRDSKARNVYNIQTLHSIAPHKCGRELSLSSVPQESFEKLLEVLEYSKLEKIELKECFKDARLLSKVLGVIQKNTSLKMKILNLNGSTLNEKSIELLKELLQKGRINKFLNLSNCKGLCYSSLTTKEKDELAKAEKSSRSFLSKKLKIEWFPFVEYIGEKDIAKVNRRNFEFFDDIRWIFNRTTNRRERTVVSLVRTGRAAYQILKSGKKRNKITTASTSNAKKPKIEDKELEDITKQIESQTLFDKKRSKKGIFGRNRQQEASCSASITRERDESQPQECKANPIPDQSSAVDNQVVGHSRTNPESLFVNLGQERQHPQHGRSLPPSSQWLNQEQYMNQQVGHQGQSQPPSPWQISGPHMKSPVGHHGQLQPPSHWHSPRPHVNPPERPANASRDQHNVNNTVHQCAEARIPQGQPNVGTVEAPRYQDLQHNQNDMLQLASAITRFGDTKIPFMINSNILIGSSVAVPGLEMQTNGPNMLGNGFLRTAPPEVSQDQPAQNHDNLQMPRQPQDSIRHPHGDNDSDDERFEDAPEERM
ncbi:uncharacterized protein LOC120341694 isoform X2 [Styela clava]